MRHREVKQLPKFTQLVSGRVGPDSPSPERTHQGRKQQKSLKKNLGLGNEQSGRVENVGKTTMYIHRWDPQSLPSRLLGPLVPLKNEG